MDMQLLKDIGDLVAKAVVIGAAIYDRWKAAKKEKSLTSKDAAKRTKREDSSNNDVTESQ